MKLLGVRRKKDGEIVLITHFGKPYKLPGDLTMKDVDIVKIVVPENISISPEEQSIQQEHNLELLKQRKQLEEFATDNKIGLGDLVALLTHSTGFKKWWDEKHGGECAPCQERQASWNYFRFAGPEFLKKLVKEVKK